MGCYSVLADEVRSTFVGQHAGRLTMKCSLAFTPLYGRWSDIFGRKFMLVTTLLVFMVFSLACALARTMIQVRIDAAHVTATILTSPQLIIFRAFQGIGGGGEHTTCR